MPANFLTDIPTGNHNAMGMIHEEKDPAILVGEEWVTIESVSIRNVPNGLYFINGAVVYTAGSTNKTNLFRLVLDGIEQPSVGVELKDRDEVLYMPFRTFIDVRAKGFDVEIEAIQVGGGAAENLLVMSTHLDYEKKSDYYTQTILDIEENQITGAKVKVLTHKQ